MTTSGLFGILAEIAEATDVATALTVAKEYGGGRCYIPRNPKENSRSPIVKLIGVDNTQKIVKDVAHGQVEIPQCGVVGSSARNRQAAELVKEGKSKPYVRRITGYSERHLRRIAAKPDNQSETPLFDFIENE